MKNAQPPGLVPADRKFFHTRLNDDHPPELCGSLGCVADRHGARDQPTCHRFRSSFRCDRRSLTLGAVQLASGHDLGVGPQAVADSRQPLGTATVINRSTKTDRAAGPPDRPTQTRTISLRLDSLSDTSVLVRCRSSKSPRRSPQRPARPRCSCPATAASRGGLRAHGQRADRSGQTLQPGRCVT